MSITEVAGNDQELDEEFRSLPTMKVDSKMLPADAYVKNRYSSVLPAPETLVPVQSDSSTGSAYINANFVKGYEGQPRAYIATQAPMENTVDDFWSMIMEQNVSVVIMVTYLFEYGVEKCIQYWPERGTTRYGSTEVSNVEEVHKDNYVRTTLRLRHVTKMTVMTVRHYAFTAWPEHGMPQSSVPLRSFLRDINTEQSQGPVVVHCSAGVGRTGVVIAIDIGMKSIERTGTVDVVNIVSRMRQDRPGAVQTRSQYRFVYKALRDHIQGEKTAVV
jgi:protein tyrosine phosphatase